MKNKLKAFLHYYERAMKIFYAAAGVYFIFVAGYGVYSGITKNLPFTLRIIMFFTSVFFIGFLLILASIKFNDFPKDEENESDSEVQL